MKAKILLLLLPIIALVACNSEEPTQNSNPVSSAVQNILFKKNSPYLDWYYSNMESFVSYSLKMYPQDTIGKQRNRATRAEDNTITLSDDIKVLLHDDYEFTNSEGKTSIQLTRSATLINGNSNAPKRMIAEDGNSHPETPVVHTYTYDIQAAQPINIIRPGIDNCNPIPMCFFQDFEIEWNADPSNENGVIIIAEWNGCTIYNPAQPVSIANVDLVEDTGTAVLNTDLFTGMPDEALVNLWLIRGNLITISEDNNEISISEMAEQHPETLEELFTENPELLIELQPFAFGSGAVTSFSFFLIRNL